MKNFLSLFALILPLLIIGCVSPKSCDWSAESVPTHREIAELPYSLIDEAERDSVIKKLESAEYIVLAQNADGYEIATQALYSYDGGTFSVCENDDGSISVFYAVLGTGYEPPHKTALKIRVKTLPSTVYVFCSTTE